MTRPTAEQCRATARGEDPGSARQSATAGDAGGGVQLDHFRSACFPGSRVRRGYPGPFQVVIAGHCMGAGLRRHDERGWVCKSDRVVARCTPVTRRTPLHITLRSTSRSVTHIALRHTGAGRCLCQMQHSERLGPLCRHEVSEPRPRSGQAQRDPKFTGGASHVGSRRMA